MPAMLTMIPLVVLYVYMISPLVDEVFMVVWNRLPLITGISAQGEFSVDCPHTTNQIS